MKPKPSSVQGIGFGVLADAVRVATAVSIPAGALWFAPGAPIVFAILLVTLILVRFAGIPRVFDLALGCLLLLAMWAAVADWYQALPWLDWVMHGAATGAVAGAARFVLARLHLMPDVTEPTAGPRAALVTTTTVGTTAAVLWEFYEWFAGAVGLPRPHIGYDDTIADLAMGTLGSLLAACAVLVWRAGHSEPPGVQ